MSFASPWQSPLYVPAGGRRCARLLRPFGGSEKRFIDRLARRQNRRVQRHLARHPPRTVLLIMPRCVKKPAAGADVQTSLQRLPRLPRLPLGDVARLCRALQRAGPGGLPQPHRLRPWPAASNPT